MEKVLELKKDQTFSLFGDLYEKKDAKEDSAKVDAVEPTLDSLAKSCKEALAEYLTLSRGLDSVFVLDREDFIQTKLNPAKKLFNERNKEFQRALLNDREIGMSLFSHRTVDAYILLEKWISLTILAGMLFSVGIFGSISALKSINKYSVVDTIVSRAYEERYKKQRGEAITESLRTCISAEVLETIQRLCSAREFKLNKTLDYDVPYEAQASYLKDRELCKRLSRDSGCGFFDCIESLEPYKLISPRERLTVLQNYSTGNCDYSRIGNGGSLFRHIDLVSDVVAMREVQVL